MASDVPSPPALLRRCRTCHTEDSPDRASIAGRQLDELARLRTALHRAKVAIAIVTDPERRRTLDAAWQEADVSVRDLAAAVHAFDLPDVDHRLEHARARVERIVADAAARGSSPRDGR
jgi:hypothetical protein